MTRVVERVLLTSWRIHTIPASDSGGAPQVNTPSSVLQVFAHTPSPKRWDWRKVSGGSNVVTREIQLPGR